MRRSDDSDTPGAAFALHAPAVVVVCPQAVDGEVVCAGRLRAALALLVALRLAPLLHQYKKVRRRLRAARGLRREDGCLKGAAAHKTEGSVSAAAPSARARAAHARASGHARSAGPPQYTLLRGTAAPLPAARPSSAQDAPKRPLSLKCRRFDVDSRSVRRKAPRGGLSRASKGFSAHTSTWCTSRLLGSQCRARQGRPAPPGSPPSWRGPFLAFARHAWRLSHLPRRRHRPNAGRAQQRGTCSSQARAHHRPRVA